MQYYKLYFDWLTFYALFLNLLIEGCVFEDNPNDTQKAVPLAIRLLFISPKFLG